MLFQILYTSGPGFFCLFSLGPSSWRLSYLLKSLPKYLLCGTSVSVPLSVAPLLQQIAYWIVIVCVRLPAELGISQERWLCNVWHPIDSQQIFAEGEGKLKIETLDSKHFFPFHMGHCKNAHLYLLIMKSFGIFPLLPLQWLYCCLLEMSM